MFIFKRLSDSTATILLVFLSKNNKQMRLLDSILLSTTLIGFCFNYFYLFSEILLYGWKSLCV